MPLRVLVSFERWRGRLAHRLTENAAVQGPLVVADKPTLRHVTLRPYLFKGFRREPWLGWQQDPNDQDTRLKTPGPAWRPTRQWARWRPQPSLGWEIAGDVAFVAPGAPAPSWEPTRAWKSWTRQPQAGWAQASDGSGDLAAGAVPQPLHRFLLQQGFRPQPGLGWASAGDVPIDLASLVPGPSFRATRQFLTRYAISLYISSGPSDGGVTPPAGGTERNERRRWLWHRSSTP